MILIKKNPSLWFGFFSVLVYAASMFSLAKQVEPVRYLIAPPQGLQYFAFGFKEAIADSLWLRAIQDFEYCEEKIDKVNCKNNGWLSKMLDSITELSPKFRIVYATGAIALSVIVSDIEGAGKIFDKAVKEFPKDWPILYRAAYHALLEEKNKPKAAALLIEVAKYGGPLWTYSLAGRLYSEEGQIELAQNLVKDLEDQKAPQAMIDKIKQRIAEAKNKPKK